MPDMDMGGAMMVSTADAGPYLMSAFIMWLLMMIAMMLPSAAPMILLYGKLARGARAQGAALAPTAIFAFVYLATWAAFSIAAAIAQLLLIRMGFVSEMTLAFGNWRIGGALLIAAGLYQLTPLKRACLEVLPLADVLPDAPLASELDRRSAHRSRAWTLLPGLLRAIDGVAVRLRSYEPGMGCGAVAFRFDRKSASIWKPNRNPWGLHRCLRRRGYDDFGRKRTLTASTSLPLPRTSERRQQKRKMSWEAPAADTKYAQQRALDVGAYSWPSGRDLLSRRVPDRPRRL